MVQPWKATDGLTISKTNKRKETGKIKLEQSEEKVKITTSIREVKRRVYRVAGIGGFRTPESYRTADCRRRRGCP